MKNAVLNDTAAKYETKDDAAAANTALDQKISQEIADRKGADSSQDERINEAAANLSQLNQNVADGFNTINQTMANGFANLSAADQVLQNEITAQNTALDTKADQSALDKETSAREAADTALDQKLGQEIADRKGADASQDKRINEVADNLSTLNQNVADGFNTINQNVADGFTAINAVNDAQQAQIDAASADAAKHSSVVIGPKGGNLTVGKQTNKDGGTEYVLGMKDDITVKTVTATDAVKAGDNTNYVIATKAGDLDATGTAQAGRVLDKSTTDGTVVKAADSVGKNLNALDAALDTKADQSALNNEIAARLGADAAQDKVIQQVNDNLVTAVNTINKNVADGFTAINSVNADQQNQINANEQAITDEVAARKAADTALDQKLGQEIADRKGADAAQDKVIQQVNDNLVTAVNTINKNVADGFTAINAVNAAQQTQIDTNTADIKTVSEAVSDTLKLDKDGNLQKQTYDPDTKTFSSADVSKVNIKGDVTATGTLQGKTITDGTASLSEGNLTGAKNITASETITGGTLTDGKATIYNGNFTTTDGNITTTNGNISAGGNLSSGGNLTVTNNGTIGGNLQVNGNTTTNGTTTTGGLTVNGASTFNGTLTAQDGTFSGDVSGKSLHSNTDITANGDISGKNINASGDLDVDGKTTTGSLDVTGDSTVGGNLEVGGTSTFKDNATFEKDVTVEGQLNVDKLHIAEDANNYTDIDGGKVTSKNMLTDDEGTVHTSVSKFDENGSSISVNDGTTTTKSTQTASGFSESLAGKGSTDEWGYNRDVSQNKGDVKVSEAISGKDGKTSNTETKSADRTQEKITDGTNTTLTNQDAKKLSNSITDGKNTSSATQNATSDTVMVKDGTNKSTVNQTASQILDTVKGADSSTTFKQDTKNIGASAEQGTITLKAKDLVNDASENMTNKVGKDLTTMSTTVKGDLYEIITGHRSSSAASMDNTATTGDIKNTAKNGTISNTAKNITNTADEGITNKAATISNETTGDLTNKVGGDLVEIITGKKSVTANEIENTATTTIKNSAASLENTATTGDIKNSAANGTIENSAKNITNKADETLSNSAKNVETTATESIKNSATNITNTASEALTNKADTITNEATTSVETKVGDTTVTTTKDGTVFSDGSTTTTIKGDTITTGTVNANDVNVANKTTTKELEVTNDATVGNDLTVGNKTATKTLEVTEDAKVGKNLEVDGDTTMKGNATVEKDLTVKGTATTKDLEVTNNANVANDLTVGNKTTTKELEVTNDATVGNDLTVANKTTTKELEVTENAKVGKDLEVGGNTTMNSNATVKGETVLEKTLLVKDNTTLEKDLSVGGDTTMSGNASVAKDLSVGGNTNVSGDVTANSYKVGDKTYIDSNGINANSQKITKVAPGEISANSTDAVNGSQLYSMKGDIQANRDDIQSNQAAIRDNQEKIHENSRRINKVGAGAAALANLHPLEYDNDSKWNAAAAIGNYRNETAGAIGIFYRPNDDVQLNLSTTVGSSDDTMIGAGLSVRLGKGGNKHRRDEATDNSKVKMLEEKVNILTTQMDALLSVLNPKMSKDFPDVPENHWAYEAVSHLAGNGIIEGEPDGQFHGDRTMTRYEMATIIYNALKKGIAAEQRLVDEFRPELNAILAKDAD